MNDSHRQVAASFDLMGLAGVSGDSDAATLRSPIDAQPLGEVRITSEEAAQRSLQALQRVQPGWAAMTASRRAQVLRVFAGRLRTHQATMAQLITLETGKVTAEARHEVQKTIDLCNFGVGLARQPHGLGVASERPEHQVFERWHPFGLCGVIGPFDEPVAFWARHAVLALVCGNGLVWHPSEKAPLSALAAHGLLRAALEEAEPAFVDIAQLWIGGTAHSGRLIEHPAVRLISAAGRAEALREMAARCAAQFKRGLFTLGSNHAAIVRPSADLVLAAREVVSAAIGGSGQQSSTLRRVFIHSRVYDELVAKLKAAYAALHIGHPAEDGTQVGPLIDGAAYDAMASALADCAQRGNRTTGGGRLNADLLPRAYYVRPALVETDRQHHTMTTTTCAPILYLQRVDDLDKAIALTHAVADESSCCIFTNSQQEAERFLSLASNRCAVTHVNIGSAGAETGGTVGGENPSDAWKSHMRRTTHMMSFGSALARVPASH